MRTTKAVVLGVLVAAAAIASTWLLDKPAVAGPPPTSLSERLSALRLDLEPLNSGDQAKVEAGGVSADAALDLATADEPTADKATAYVGKLTDHTQHVGDMNSPLSIEKRLVYAVLLEGVETALHGPIRDRNGPQSVTMDMVYFVDAVTGEGIMAQTI